MREIVVSKSEEGYKLRRYLMLYLSGAPQSFIYKMLRKKNIVLNDRKADGNEALRVGDSVKLYLAEDTIEKFRTKSDVHGAMNEDSGISNLVIYEDDDIIAVNKPAGVLSQKAAPQDVSINEMIIEYLRRSGSVTDESMRIFKPSVCNRLDRNTSGVILAGKTHAGTDFLTERIRSRRVYKQYIAVLTEHLPDRYVGRELRGDIVKDSKTNISTYKETPKGHVAIIIEKAEYIPDKNVTKAYVRLITGKSHQIRVQCSSLGYPIVGDTKYGDTEVNRSFRSRYGVKRQQLHAYIVKIGDKTITAEPPEDFMKL